MKFSLPLVASGLVALAAAHPERMDKVPASKRAAAPTDVEILNYALTLEYLERDFYALGLSLFSKKDFAKAGYNSFIYAGFKQIAEQEKSHVSFLAGALGDAGVGECQYNFGITSVDSFVATARLLEGTGSAAYLGAAGDISNKEYLAAAGSILAVEARHASFLNSATRISGFPQAYETSLDYSQVYSLAAGFIVPNSCGTSGSLPPGIHAYPKLKIKTAVPKAGKKIGLHFPIPAGYTGPYYVQFISGSTPAIAQIDASNGVATVPASLKGVGATYVVISKDVEALSDSNTIAGPTPILL